MKIFIKIPIKMFLSKLYRSAIKATFTCLVRETFYVSFAYIVIVKVQISKSIKFKEKSKKTFPKESFT